MPRDSFFVVADGHFDDPPPLASPKACKYLLCRGSSTVHSQHLIFQSDLVVSCYVVMLCWHTGVRMGYPSGLMACILSSYSGHRRTCRRLQLLMNERVYAYLFVKMINYIKKMSTIWDRCLTLSNVCHTQLLLTGPKEHCTQHTRTSTYAHIFRQRCAVKIHWQLNI